MGFRIASTDLVKYRNFITLIYKFFEMNNFIISTMLKLPVNYLAICEIIKTQTSLDRQSIFLNTYWKDN